MKGLEYTPAPQRARQARSLFYLQRVRDRGTPSYTSFRAELFAPSCDDLVLPFRSEEAKCLTTRTL